MSVACCMLTCMYCHSPLEVRVVQSLQRCQLDASGVKLVAQLLPQLEVQMIRHCLWNQLLRLLCDGTSVGTMQSNHSVGVGVGAQGSGCDWLTRQVCLKRSRPRGALLESKCSINLWYAMHPGAGRGRQPAAGAGRAGGSS